MGKDPDLDFVVAMVAVAMAVVAVVAHSVVAIVVAVDPIQVVTVVVVAVEEADSSRDHLAVEVADSTHRRLVGQSSVDPKVSAVVVVVVVEVAVVVVEVVAVVAIVVVDPKVGFVVEAASYYRQTTDHPIGFDLGEVHSYQLV